MMKKVFFLVSLPRAGNVLLSSILNQNPDIAVTDDSKILLVFRDLPDHPYLNNATQEIINAYYKKWKQKYIIDRSPWGVPINLEILKKTGNDIKIIVLTRDIIEVLASFIRWSEKNPNNFIDKLNFKTKEEQCNYLINRSMISNGLVGIKHLLSEENKSLCHFVKYNDLVKYPQRIIKEIYNYLEIPPFKHRYTNLDQYEVNGKKYDDNFLGKELHTIRTDRIYRSEYDRYNMIPKAIIKEHRKEWLL